MQIDNDASKCVQIDQSYLNLAWELTVVIIQPELGIWSGVSKKIFTHMFTQVMKSKNKVDLQEADFDVLQSRRHKITLFLSIEIHICCIKKVPELWKPMVVEIRSESWCRSYHHQTLQKSCNHKKLTKKGCVKIRNRISFIYYYFLKILFSRCHWIYRLFTICVHSLECLVHDY